MSILKGTYKEAGDLIALERVEAIVLQSKIIEAWQPQSQV
jgi:hypothetical protein